MSAVRPVPEASAADLDQVLRTPVFFGHQSVGANLLTGVPAVFAAAGLDPPPDTLIAEDLVGENGRPLSKLDDFATILRNGMAEKVDVAMVKLCYVDVTAGTDVEALFAAYRDTLAALGRDLPRISLVAVTVPVTTEPPLRSRIRARLTGLDLYGPAANARREHLNRLVRDEYGERVFDLAAVESTAPDGTRVGGRHRDQDYFCLHPGYASDPGHLNADGCRRAAAAWLAAVARAGRR